MQRKSESPRTLEDHFQHSGCPHSLKSDNAKEFKSVKFLNALRQAQVDPLYTEPHHPNQNIAELRGGRIKHIVQHILLLTGAPREYWCYCLEFVAFVRARTARRSLGNRTAFEREFGWIPDISKCRFSFWQPIWFYTPRGAFPSQRMSKGRFLGFSLDSGDAFTYIIVTEPDDENEARQVFTRSVIRPRYIREDAPVVVRSGNKFEIFKKDERTVLLALRDPEVPPSLSGFVQPQLPTIQEEPQPLDSVEEYERSIEEVYGPPPSKRLRIDPESPARFRLDPVDNQPLLDDVDSRFVTQTVETIPPIAHQELAPVLELEPPHFTEADPTADPADVPPRDSLPTVTQEEQDANDSDNDSVHSADADLDQDHVTADSVDTHLHNLAGDVDDEVELFDSIVGHEFRDGKLFLQVLWKTNEMSWVSFLDCKEDLPYETAQYIVSNVRGGPPGTTFSSGSHNRWARTFMKKTNRVLRRFLRYHGYSKPMVETQVFRYPHEDEAYTLRYTRVQPKSTSRRILRRTKPGRLRRPLEVKFGIKIPRNVKEALALDAESGTTHWRDAMTKEIASLVAMNCFTFHPPGYKPGPNSQKAPLRMIFEVKQDGRRKGRLVCGGHLVDPRGISTKSTVVKGISVRLLDLIAHRDNLTTLHGDVGNAFITANCLEEVHAIAGPEFGEEREGAIMTINKALYGLRSSSRAYRETFAAFLRQIGFNASRYDRDVWMRLREEKDGYDYLCTHVDDFKVVARDPQRWVNAIAGAFQLKCAGTPDYYLGMNYTFDEEERCWLTGTKTYVEECIRRIEGLLPPGRILCTHNTPAPSEGQASHPETDRSDLLDDAGKRQYQMLVGMAQWAVTIGRVDIAFATSSLSRFSAAPRETHLEIAFHLFGYLKKFPDKRLPIDSRPLLIQTEKNMEKGHFAADFLKEYPDAREDRDPKEPDAYGQPLQTSVFFDANLAHDLATRRSITGILVFVGSTLVSWTSKRQGCIASSTYCAEFIAMRAAVEEAISIRFMLRSLGVPVEEPTNLIGDNLGVIQNASIPDSDIKKKHVAISYHTVREAVAAKIVKPIWCDTRQNWADICTKALGTIAFVNILRRVML